MFIGVIDLRRFWPFELCYLSSLIYLCFGEKAKTILFHANQNISQVLRHSLR
jgi:hypothetical protein